MAEREKRLSTPLVLTAASAMLAVAAIVWLSLDEPAAAPEREEDEGGLRIDDTTPERVAESFYDAWRRRRWDEAAQISVGRARREVLQKRAADLALPREERIVAERTWDALSRAPLTFVLDTAEMLGEDRHRLSGTAEYLFVGRPYRRRVQFVVVPEQDRYRVREMALGEVLTELPEIFRGAGEAP